MNFRANIAVVVVVLTYRLAACLIGWMDRSIAQSEDARTFSKTDGSRKQITFAAPTPDMTSIHGHAVLVSHSMKCAHIEALLASFGCLFLY